MLREKICFNRSKSKTGLQCVEVCLDIFTKFYVKKTEFQSCFLKIWNRPERKHQLEYVITHHNFLNIRYWRIVISIVFKMFTSLDVLPNMSAVYEAYFISEQSCDYYNIFNEAHGCPANPMTFLISSH